MKNVHVIATTPNDETSKGVWIGKTRDWCNIYITNLEEIKEGDIVKNRWVISKHGFIIKADRIENGYLIHSNGKSNYLYKYKFIILTTDKDLIADGVQGIPDEFLEWFYKWY